MQGCESQRSSAAATGGAKEKQREEMLRLIFLIFIAKKSQKIQRYKWRGEIVDNRYFE